MMDIMWEEYFVIFLIYINDLPLVLNKISTSILFADDTSVIIDEPDPSIYFKIDLLKFLIS
jgi:hypothetical protein